MHYVIKTYIRLYPTVKVLFCNRPESWITLNVIKTSKVPFTMNCLKYLITYMLTYSMEQSPSWEANRSSASQEIPPILWNPKVHYCVTKSLPPVPTLSLINPVHAPYPTSWRSILILSSDLCLGLKRLRWSIGSVLAFGTQVRRFTLLMWRIWWAPTNVSKWQMGIISTFKGLIITNLPFHSLYFANP